MSERTTGGTAGVVGALVVDAVLVVAFAVIGRSSHAEGVDVAGVWGTAWPFLVGLGVGWLATRAWRHPLALWPTGVVVWAATLVGGMLLRLATGQGTAVAFIVTYYGPRLIPRTRLRAAAIILFVAAFGAAVVGGAFGAFINKVAPIV